MKDMFSLLSDLRIKGIRVWAEGDALRYSAPKGVMDDDLRALLIHYKKEIVNFLNTVTSASWSGLMENSMLERKDEGLPISYPQERRWVWYQIAPQHNGYNINLAFHLQGVLNMDALKRALDEIIHRHEALRTTICLIDNEPRQVIAQSVEAPLTISDISQLEEEQKQQRLEHIYEECGAQPFVLERGPLFRMMLVKLGPQSHGLLLVFDHAIFDGWSLEIFKREFGDFYESLAVYGTMPQLPILKFQYGDFSLVQRNMAGTAYFKKQLDYWKNQLQPSPPLLELPKDKKQIPKNTIRSIERADASGSLSFVIDESLGQQLRTICLKYKVTLFMALLAAFGVLLHRYTSQEDIVIGSPVANRSQPGTDQVIGCFINVLPLRIDMSGNPPFFALLEKVKEIILSGYENQEVPLELMVREVKQSRSLDYMPFFQVMFNVLNIPATSVSSAVLGKSGLTVSSLMQVEEGTIFDLELTFRSIGDELFGTLAYRTDLYSRKMITNLIENFKVLLASITTHPHKSIRDLDILADDQRHHLLMDWNNACRDNPNRCIHHLIQEQALRKADAVALIHEEKKLSYGDLNRLANAVANYLAAAGIREGSLVALLAERSIEFVVVVLGILKAGYGFLPLDPLSPPIRTINAIRHSSTPIILLSDRFVSSIKPGIDFKDTDQAVRLIVLEDLLSDIKPSVQCPELGNLDDLAYVIYTSGSTGIPKGVRVGHKGMLNHILSKIEDLRITEEDVVAQTASQSFDISVWQMLAPLVAGGKVSIMSNEVVHNPAALIDSIRDKEVKIVEVVPSLLHMIIEEMHLSAAKQGDLSSLRWMIATGEVLPPQTCRDWLELFPATPLLNAYGPTECSDDVTHYVVNTPPPLEVERVPIGRPIRNIRIYVLDEMQRIVPAGVKGEIYVGGIGVGYGYINDPERTQAAFISDPFSDDRGAKLYKTGDIGRVLIDGNLEFLGRIDDQVKIRGYRIELGEIENTLNSCSGIRESVVLLENEQNGTSHLVAYLIAHSDGAVDEYKLRLALRKRLPEYMIPSTFIWCNDFPRSSSDKVDRRKLREIKGTVAVNHKEYKAPKTSTEKRIAAIWAQVLGLPRVGLYDDFFRLGGHSITAITAMQRIRQTFNIELTLSDLFDVTILRDLSARIDEILKQGPSPIAAMTVEEMQAEALLDPAIQPQEYAIEQSLAPISIFLTGSTGFLGSFLLYELVQRTQAQIYCLMRASNDSEAWTRLEDDLKKKMLWNDSIAQRIIPILGDLTQPRFGLGQEKFRELSCKITHIYHCGAWVNLLSSYRALKATNVLGTQEILRLAAEGMVKPVHHISTLSVMASIERNAKIIKEDDDLESIRSLNGGYAQSKWIAEKLMAEAQIRGIPAAIYRPHRLSGHSRTGVWNTEDLVCRIIKGCIQVGIVPDTEATIEITPVDFVAKAIVQLSLKPASLGKVFHLVNSYTMRLSTLVEIIKSMGYHLERIPYPLWQARMFETARADEDNALYPIMNLFSEQMTEELMAIQSAMESPELLPVFDTTNTEEGLKGSAIECPPLDDMLLRVYFNYFNNCRFIKMPVKGAIYNQ